MNFLQRLFHRHKYENTHEIQGRCTVEVVSIFSSFRGDEEAVVYIEECKCGSRRGVFETISLKKFVTVEYIMALVDSQ